MVIQIWLHFAVVALVMIPLERLTALRPGQRLLRKGCMLDATYALINAVVVPAGVAGMLTLVFLASSFVVSEEIRKAIGAMPLWLAAPLAILIADLGFYVAHRTFHSVPILWRFHAVHHSIEHMDWLAAHRVHPIDQIVTKSVSLTPLLVLGFSTESMAVFALLYQWQSLLIHANTRLKFGWLENIFASPRFHHWHHANHPEAFDRNFAGQFSFIDRLLGTLHMPADRYPTHYGTDDRVGTAYLRQLTQPFIPPASRLSSH